MKKTLLALLLILLIGGGAYWWFVLRVAPTPTTDTPTNPENPFPFSTTTPIGTPATSTPTFGDTTDTTPLPTLYQISTEPVAGFSLTETEEGGENIRFVTKNTGHVFETKTNSRIITRLSNTTLPEMVSAQFVENGEALIAQFATDGGLRTFYGQLLPVTSNENSEPFELIGSFISEKIKDITVSPDTKSIFYLTENTNGAFGIVANPDGSSPRTIFTSPLQDWHADWVNNTTVSLTTYPAANALGIHRLLNTRTERETNILGSILGLTVLANQDANQLLYSKSALLSEIDLYAYNIETGNNPRISVETLPEKCVWSKKDSTKIYCGVPKTLPQAGYPDAWYRGVVIFSDVLWEIDIETGRTNRLYDPENTNGTPIDTSHIKLNKDETHLLFINKTDSTLWTLEI